MIGCISSLAARSGPSNMWRVTYKHSQLIDTNSSDVGSRYVCIRAVCTYVTQAKFMAFKQCYILETELSQSVCVSVCGGGSS